MTPIPLNIALAGLIILIMTDGCSERQSAGTVPADSTTTSASSAAIAPPDTRQPPDAPPDTTHDALHVESSVAGVSTSYSVYFDGAQLQRIAEARKPAGTGDYRFHGARLTQYTGTALHSAANIELRFDLQGALITKQQAASVNESEIAEIRNRAQLLRSMALARRATQAHTGHD